MERLLLNNLSDFNTFCDEHKGYAHGYGLPTGAPDTFPCLLLYQIRDNPTGLDYMEYEFVERSDIPEPLTLANLFGPEQTG